MRVAILSESPADEAALRIIVDSILGTRTTPVDLSLRSRGWPSVRDVLGAVIRSLHYKTDADGLVVVADSNHNSVIEPIPKNRLRELLAIVDRNHSALNSKGGRVPIRVAVGIASPAIEAWWLCKKHAEITEANWEKGLKEKNDPYTKLVLKQRLYGVDLPSIALTTERMTQAARELATEIAFLENRFPNGFGSLAKQLRAWRRIGE